MSPDKCKRWALWSAKNGAGLGFTSSDEGSDDAGPGADAGPAGGVVVEVASEWGGFGDTFSTFGDADADLNSRRAKQRDSRRARMSADGQAAEIGPAASRRPTLWQEVRRKGLSPHFICECLKSQGTRFVVISVLHIAGWWLQWSCMYIYSYWIRERFNRSRVYIIAPIQVLGSLLGLYITFHDADVIHRLHEVRKRSGDVAFCVTALFCVVFLGLAQGIAVKRAWRRQMYTAEVAADWDDPDDLHASKINSVTYGGAERSLPLALFTGMPFLLVNTIATISARWQWADYSWYVLWGANIITLFNVSFGIVEIDVAVSSYVMKRYHMNPKITGSRAGGLQWLYPFAHVLFRSSEVFLRVTMISLYFVILKLLVGREFVLVGVLIDYLVGFALLKMHSPDQERLTSHAVVAGMLLFVNVAHFVDQPNFAHPAKEISKGLSIWRAISMAVLLVIICLAKGQLLKELSYGSIDGTYTRSWLFEPKYILYVLMWYCVLRFSPWTLHVGDDLHTAARSGKEKRVKKLLEPDDQGQVLDVDGKTQDNMQLTPSMLAAKFGQHKILKQLHSKGANMNFRSSVTGNTPLHLAAEYDRAETCEWLIDEGGADRSISNKQGLTPDDIVNNKRPRTKQVFAERTRSRHSISRISPSEQEAYANVPAQFCASLQLKGLFPDAADDDTPSPRALQSVSGLVFSRGAGLLARCVLSRETDGGTVPLGALKKVGELGKGGFGKVIEVELPAEGGFGNLLRRQSLPTKRYALKLQLKQHCGNAAFSENSALRTVQHPYIVRLERAFNTPKHFALLLELCPTDMNRILCSPKDEDDGRCDGLKLETAARYMAQVLLAVVHLQNMNIVYRDLKPENILISEDDRAKLTDFGLAKVVTSADRMSMCGTMGFFPPELLFGGDDSDSNSTAAGGSRPSTRRSRRRSSSLSTCSSFDHNMKSMFKLDSYSYGVTLQLALLGEDGGQRKDIRRKGYMMLPIHQSEQENQAMLLELNKKEKLSDEALCLLLGDEDVKALDPSRRWKREGAEEQYHGLLNFNPRKRTLLSKVVKHPFFQQEVKCQETRNYLELDSK